jgi:hypothetical protein
MRSWFRFPAPKCVGGKWGREKREKGTKRRERGREKGKEKYF